jgi:hypothetical protein
MADIFITYSKSSKAQTEQLAKELQAQGHSVWWDTSLVPGDSFRNVILSELEQARAAIVIWDTDSVKSEWVCSEASRARARGILVPVKTEGVRSHDIPPPFDSLHTELLSNRARAVFLYAFDLIALDGEDMRPHPWETRRATLAGLLRKAGRGIRLSEHLDGTDGETVFQHACRMGLEGIVAKRMDRPYRSGRCPDWVKVKNPDAPAASRVIEP